MTCPKCGSDKLKVIDSRHHDCESVWRIRECADCFHRFTTVEYEEELADYKKGEKT